MYTQIEKSTGEPHPRLEQPNIPIHGLFLWEQYWGLRKSEPISYADIKAYCDITGVILDIWECKALMEIDMAVESSIQQYTKKMSS